MFIAEEEPTGKRQCSWSVETYEVVTLNANGVPLM